MDMKKAKITAYLALIVIFSLTLAAMLGQVDSELAGWYLNKDNYWQLPWYYGRAVYIWEQEYALIIISFIGIALSSFALGYEVKDKS